MTIELCDEIIEEFIVTGLVGGVNYKFKVRARNIYGYGAFSDEFILEASDLPGKPIEPTISLSTTFATVSWQAPSSHNAVID